MFIGNKKCRIYAACGVSQTPIYSFYTEGKIIDEEDAYYLENSFSDFGSIGMCYYGVILLSGQGE